MPHENLHVSKTIGLLTSGPYRSALFGAVVLLGIFVPIIFAVITFETSAWSFRPHLARARRWPDSGRTRRSG